MNTNTIITTSKNEWKGEYKVIEVNVAVSEDYLYAVCTPVKKQ